MAEAAGAAPAQQQQPASRVATATTGDVVSARLQQVLALLFPSNLAAKAALFALVVALLPLLPTSQAPRIWELPHLLLLGIIISYGVFGQKNADAEVAAAAAADAKPIDDEASSVEAYVSQMMQGSPLVFEDNDRDGDDGGASKVGVQAWSSQYLPDDPLVIVADANNGDGNGNAGEKPLLLPMRKLKPAAEDSAALTDDIGNAIEEEEEKEEEEFVLAPKAGYDGVRERAIPSPSSVLDADLTLSPSSPPLLPPLPPPPPPPFLGRERRNLRKPKARSFNEFGAIGNRSTNQRLGLHSIDCKQFRSKSAVRATRSAFAGYDPVVPIGGDDDDDAVDDAELDEVVASSESSFSSDMVADSDEDIKEDENIFKEDEEAAEEEDGSSCDEELFELATKPGPEVEEEAEDEVDRKADEFIAKFREQIRMQRVEPAATTRR
ncbi:uncharacterized protein LOC120642679 [Panicum virgatum]|uniref:Uncharacterized protein n=1 Tax=Panicum virgatum TaxID=38727 RepID=A0A8T0QP02_PANVG|nr:uncharacterized protein LOC120642679 [Panicum virgatum]KAG2573776.1 hypothetical protein PVAP13_7KG276800 [Panicum virgatum]